MVEGNDARDHAEGLTQRVVQPTITGGVVLSGLIQLRPVANKSKTAMIILTGSREGNTAFRKTVIGDVLGIPAPARDAGTVACIVAGYLRGAQIFRVHDVRAAVQSLRMLDAIGCANESAAGPATGGFARCCGAGHGRSLRSHHRARAGHRH